ncbi:hypothetical protein [Parasedimentitalea huanghaiensis]|uniref:hypothetical protein n=1 Tax=Parasedimentitalea huanghaiensis TaxID=2682100 RepID=UPI001AD9EC60|nr:hypothetical protein [Zongyanglinia huanghaiensis]
MPLDFVAQCLRYRRAEGPRDGTRGLGHSTQPVLSQYGNRFFQIVDDGVQQIDDKGSVFLAMLPDTGERYLSTPAVRWHRG